jgi:hypothetical protein
MLGEYLGAGASTTKLLLHLNGNSTDSSGNGNNGTGTSITYSLANGIFGQGAGFNGSSSKITTPLGNFGTGNFTISLWIKTTQEATRVIFGKTTEVDKDNGGYVLYRDSGGYHAFRFGTIVNLHIQNQYIATGGWNVITIVRNGANGYIYSNSNLIVSTSSISSFNQNTSGTFTLGTSPGSNWTPRFYSGAIDEVIVENRAWTASEIKKYYTYSKGRF